MTLNVKSLVVHYLNIAKIGPKANSQKGCGPFEFQAFSYLVCNNIVDCICAAWFGVKNAEKKIVFCTFIWIWHLANNFDE